MRTCLNLAAGLAVACAAFGQGPRFEAADVHATPSTTSPAARGPFMNGVRYDLRSASVVDLIVRAYDVTADKVLDGPNWVEYDRFDIAAAVPAKTTADAAKAMLQNLLTERFGLAIRKEDRPLPAYVLTAPKGTSKMKEADGTGNTGCLLSIAENRSAPPPRPEDGAPPLPVAPTITYTCRNMSMAAFADGLRNMALAQQFIGTNPVKNNTGVEGKWDFNFKYTLPIGTGDTTTLPDALDKQLGLKLEQQTTPLPVIVVEKVNRPTANEPDVAKKIPAYAKEFEVATVKPFVPTPGLPTLMGMRPQPGGRVEISGLSLKMLLQQAFNIPVDSMVGVPSWTDTDRYSIVAKIPGEGGMLAPNSPMDTESLSLMLQALLKERFQLEVHYEERPQTAYNLTAPKPKIKKADPAGRIKWTDGAAGGFIMLNGTSLPSRTLKMQNMTMEQFAEKLQFLGSSYIHSPVVNATGLEGSYDFSLTFSPIAPEQLAAMLSSARAQGATGGLAASSDPMGGVSLFDAVDKQLGLKLVEQKRPVRVLVIDHIERQVTEN